MQQSSFRIRVDDDSIIQCPLPSYQIFDPKWDQVISVSETELFNVEFDDRVQEGSKGILCLYFRFFVDPPESIRNLVSKYFQVSGKRKITIRLTNEKPKGRIGEFNPTDEKIGLWNIATDYQKNPEDFRMNPLGVRAIDTLLHEMGHQMMFELYGKTFPNYEGHEGHDGKPKAESQTNPGAA